MLKKNIFLYLGSVIFILGFFIIQTPRVYAAEGLELENIKTSLQEYSVKFTWYTKTPSDSWVDLDPNAPTGTSLRYTSQQDGTYKSNDSFLRLIDKKTNDMVGRCDGNGLVQTHCVELLTPTPRTVYPFRVQSCVKDTSGKEVCDTSKVLSFQSGRTMIPPKPVKNFRITHSDEKGVSLAWDRTFDNEPRWYAGYYLYNNETLIYTIKPKQWFPSSDARDILNKNIPMDTAITEYTYLDTHVSSGRSYSYTIKSFSISEGETAISSPLKGVTPISTVTPIPTLQVDEIPKKTKKPLLPKESTFTKFKLHFGKLVYSYTYVPDSSSIDQDPNVRPNCFGKTYFLDAKKNMFMEDIDGEFSGALTPSKGEDGGEWDGSVNVTIQPTDMRYEIICGWISKMIEIHASDWGSDDQIREFRSLQTRAATNTLRDAKKKAAVKIPKGVDVTVSVSQKTLNSKKEEKVAVFSLDVPGGAAFSPRPGDQKAIVGLFDVIVYEPIRIKTLKLKVHDRKNLPFSRLYLNVDGKPSDSFDSDYDFKREEFFFRGLGDHALANKLTIGKHRLAILADMRNPGKKNILTDNFSIIKVQALTGKSVKADMTKSINLKAYTVKARKLASGNEGQAYESYVDELKSKNKKK